MTENSEKLYDQLYEWFHTIDWVQSSPVILHSLLKEVSEWIEGNSVERDHLGDEWREGYNAAIQDLLSKLK